MTSKEDSINKSGSASRISLKSSKKYKINLLNFCVKYNPPTIGLHYTYKGREDKSYLHQIKPEITSLSDPQILYDSIIQSESFYLESSEFNKAQLLRIIETLIEKCGASMNGKEETKSPEARESESDKHLAKPPLSSHTKNTVTTTNFSGEAETGNNEYMKSKKAAVMNDHTTTPTSERGIIRQPQNMEKNIPTSNQKPSPKFKNEDNYDDLINDYLDSDFEEDHEEKSQKSLSIHSDKKNQEAKLSKENPPKNKNEVSNLWASNDLDQYNTPSNPKNLENRTSNVKVEEDTPLYLKTSLSNNEDESLDFEHSKSKESIKKEQSNEESPSPLKKEEIVHRLDSSPEGDKGVKMLEELSISDEEMNWESPRSQKSHKSIDEEPSKSKEKEFNIADEIFLTHKKQKEEDIKKNELEITDSFIELQKNDEKQNNEESFTKLEKEDEQNESEAKKDEEEKLAKDMKMLDKITNQEKRNRMDEIEELENLLGANDDFSENENSMDLNKSGGQMKEEQFEDDIHKLEKFEERQKINTQELLGMNLSDEENEENNLEKMNQARMELNNNSGDSNEDEDQKDLDLLFQEMANGNSADLEKLLKLREKGLIKFDDEEEVDYEELEREMRENPDLFANMMEQQELENDDEEGEGEEMEFQRVFVEELNQELLMDRKGNLFDMQGNHLGMAANQEEGDDDEEDDYDDLKELNNMNDYFDDDIDLDDLEAMNQGNPKGMQFDHGNKKPRKESL